MIDKIRARAIVAKLIGEGKKVDTWTAKGEPDSGWTIAIVDDATEEHDFGWVFYMQSKECLDGDESKQIFGPGPIVVDKEDGSVTRYGSGDGISGTWIEKHRKMLKSKVRT